MAANKDAFLLHFVKLFCTNFYLQCLENYRESKLKVFLFFRTFSKLSYDRAMYFCNVFEARTLLPSSYFSFYKFTSENVRRILITTKTKSTSSSRCPNFGQFCLSEEDSAKTAIYNTVDIEWQVSSKIHNCTFTIIRDLTVRKNSLPLLDSSYG